MDQRKPCSAAVRGHEGEITEVTETCVCHSFMGSVLSDKDKPSDRPIYFCQSRLSGGDEQWTWSLMYW